MTHVSLAFLFNENGEVLIARRPDEKMFGGLWEFPGGKLEGNESAGDALIRELEEELSIGTAVIELLRSYEYVMNDDTRLYFHPIVVEHLVGEIHLREHSEAAWVPPLSIENYSLAPPDYDAAVILREYIGREAE
ncbi:(deoxy)nucleoside triphosphate pyrophosphohydrolase [Draconibacterium sp.]|nr:(deoxy)nucleoside triphosphate pyrophosphohydrolase [Luminiphilus sp.]MDB4582103.1 (deoxy)nucleoside triphosphate pyrophosphohydrolase [Draconibacterium sp.]MDC6485803.1 (deoxy)nucleoside triphosphate pyrophosphohydrolase [Luminiphilus sp.]